MSSRPAILWFKLSFPFVFCDTGACVTMGNLLLSVNDRSHSSSTSRGKATNASNVCIFVIGTHWHEPSRCTAVYSCSINAFSPIKGWECFHLWLLKVLRKNEKNVLGIKDAVVGRPVGTLKFTVGIWQTCRCQIQRWKHWYLSSGSWPKTNRASVLLLYWEE